MRYAKVRRITDIPTERSSHQVPTPKGGGVGFVLFTLLALSTYLIINGTIFTIPLFVFLIASVIIATLGWFDDKHDLSKRIRFGVQLLAALLIIILVTNLDAIYLPLVGTVDLGIAGGFLALIWITGSTNIYNFMDGVDGIASAQAVGVAIGWMAFAYIWNVPELFYLNSFILASVVTFILYNWPPAKIFMGDVGSIFLGFVFGAMPFMAANLSSDVSIGVTIWVSAFLLWPFLFDGSYTIFRRLSHEENIFEAHRSHLYQRLNIEGWTHKEISILYMVFSVLCVLFSIAFYLSSGWVQVLLFAGLIVLSILYVVYVKQTELSNKDG